MRRLEIACTAFREKHGTWPTEARLAPFIIYDLTHILTEPHWARLCERLQIRTTSRAHFAVGNEYHHLVYEKLAEHPSQDAAREASRWLGVEIDPAAWGNSD